jgi:hypothetical protein
VDDVELKARALVTDVPLDEKSDETGQKGSKLFYLAGFEYQPWREFTFPNLFEQVGAFPKLVFATVLRQVIGQF